MSYEIEPNKVVSPETEVVTAEPQELTEPPRKPLSGSAILTACVLLAIPTGYLLLHHGSTNAVQARAAQTAAPNTVNMPALEAALKADPSEANKINLSLGYIQTGQEGRAVRLLDGMTALDPKDAMAWNNLCVAHTLEQEFADGIAACNQAVSLKPDFQLAKNNLAWVSGERDKTVKAITQLEQTDPVKRDATFYLTEGLDYLHLGNYQEATQAWSRMLEVDPKSATAANNIGLAKMMEKQPDQAIPWFQKAIVLDPAMQLAKNNLVWAKSVKAEK
jgi:tetratricopeptide (TPR) repeat protein